SEFYFAARDAQGDAAIYRTPSKPGSKAEKIAGGSPLDTPLGLVMSCDGATLFIADAGAGAIFTMPAAGGALTSVEASGIARPGGLAMGPKCDTLYVTAYTT